MTAMPLRALAALLRRLARDDRGGLIVEAVIVLPVLLWAYLALFVFWDAYRTVNVVQKSSYALADFLSRQRTPVNAAFIDGLRRSMDYMIDTDQRSMLRVTSLQWSEERNRHEVLWSHSPQNVRPALTTASLASLSNRLPAMTNGETVVLLEVLVPYVPAFKVGVPARNVEQFIVTRPRLSPRIEWSGS